MVFKQEAFSVTGAGNATANFNVQLLGTYVQLGEDVCNYFNPIDMSAIYVANRY